MKLISKIVGATLGLAMAVGVSVGVVNNRKATELNADETYSNREFAFTSSPLPTGLEISSSGGMGSNLYKMSDDDWATIDASAMFVDGDVLSTDMSISVKIGTFGTWSGAKTAKYTVAFLDGNGSVLTSAVGNSKNGMSSSAAYSNGPAVTLPAPDDTSAIAKLKITFSDLTSTSSGYLRFAGAQLTYNTETADTSAATSVVITASGSTTLDLNETVTLSAVVKDANNDDIDGAVVTFSSSNPTVASVGETTGVVTASASNYGSTTITASYAGDATHNASSATMLIRVSDPNTATFVIKDIASENSWENATAYDSLGTLGVVSITGAGDPNNMFYYNSGNGTWRFYSSGGGQFTVSTSAGYLKKVTLTTDGSHYFTTAPSNWSYSNDVFTASNKLQTSATFANGSGTSKIEQIEVKIGYAYTVTYNANGGSGTITDSNSPYDKGSTVTVKENTFTAPSGFVFDRWNTAPNGTGIDYNAGNTFSINANTVLYAQWVSAGSDPYVGGVADTISGVYSASSLPITFNYGNFENEISVSSSNTSVLTVTNIDTNDEDNSSATLNFVAGGSANLLFKDGDSLVKSVAVTVTASVVSITGLPASKDCMIGYPLDLGSTITVTNIGSYSDDVSWESDDTSVATVDENGIVTGVSVGTTEITVTSDDYDTAKMTCVVAVSYKSYKLEKVSSLAVGDIVFLTSDAVGKQLNGIDGGNTKYATGASYTGEPNKETYALKVEAGIGENTVAFKIVSGTDSGNYLYWESGNSLDIVDEKSANSSWKVSFDASNNATIKNAADETRVIWWNVGSPRFACYTNKTNGNDYKYIQLWKLTSPEQCVKSAEAVVTIQGDIIRFGSTISQEAWNVINADWPITNYGVMFYKTDSLVGLPENPVETAYRAGVVAPKIVAKGSGAAPTPVDGKYTFTARVKVENNDTIFCAASFIVAGGRYYFFNEVQASASSLA